MGGLLSESYTVPVTYLSVICGGVFMYAYVNYWY